MLLKLKRYYKKILNDFNHILTTLKKVFLNELSRHFRRKAYHRN